MEETKYITIPEMTGIYGEASVRITQATFKLGKESTKLYPDKDFGFWLIEQIDQNHKYLAKTFGFYGIIKTKYSCRSCKSQLDPKTRTPMETEIELKYKEFQPFRMKLSFPSVVCLKCQKVNGIDMDTHPGSMIYGAIINAFEKEGIKPR